MFLKDWPNIIDGANITAPDIKATKLFYVLDFCQGERGSNNHIEIKAG